MAAGTYGFKCPEIYNPNGLNPHSLTVPVATSISDSHVKGMCVKSWVKLSTNSVITVAGGAENPFGRVVSIRNPMNYWQNIQFVTAAQLLANVYELTIEPCGDLTYQGTEDALTTPITDANSGAPGTPTIYANFAAPVDPTNTPNGNNPYGSPVQTLKIASTSVTTSAGSTALILKGLVPNYGNRIYSATSLASPRSFLFTPRAATADQATS